MASARPPAIICARRRLLWLECDVPTCSAYLTPAQGARLRSVGLQHPAKAPTDPAMQKRRMPRRLHRHYRVSRRHLHGPREAAKANVARSQLLRDRRAECGVNISPSAVTQLRGKTVRVATMRSRLEGTHTCFRADHDFPVLNWNPSIRRRAGQNVLRVLQPLNVTSTTSSRQGAAVRVAAPGQQRSELRHVLLRRPSRGVLRRCKRPSSTRGSPDRTGLSASLPEISAAR